MIKYKKANPEHQRIVAVVAQSLFLLILSWLVIVYTQNLNSENYKSTEIYRKCRKYQNGFLNVRAAIPEGQESPVSEYAYTSVKGETYFYRNPMSDSDNKESLEWTLALFNERRKNDLPILYGRYPKKSGEILVTCHWGYRNKVPADSAIGTSYYIRTRDKNSGQYSETAYTIVGVLDSGSDYTHIGDSISLNYIDRSLILADEDFHSIKPSYFLPYFVVKVPNKGFFRQLVSEYTLNNIISYEYQWPPFSRNDYIHFILPAILRAVIFLVRRPKYVFAHPTNWKEILIYSIAFFLTGFIPFLFVDILWLCLLHSRTFYFNLLYVSLVVSAFLVGSLILYLTPKAISLIKKKWEKKFW